MLVSRTRSSRDPGAAPRGQWHFDGCSQSMKRSQMLCTCRENFGRGTTYWSIFCFAARLTAFWPPAGDPPDRGVCDAFVFFVCQSRQSCGAFTTPQKLDLAHWVTTPQNIRPLMAIVVVRCPTWGEWKSALEKHSTAYHNVSKKYGRIATLELTASKKSDFV